MAAGKSVFKFGFGTSSGSVNDLDEVKYGTIVAFGVQPFQIIQVSC